MHQYKLISRKGEGTFSEVLKAQSLKTSNYVAIKCMKTHFNSVEQVNQLREIQALRKTSPHPHIIKLLEILYDEPTGRLALVFELMDMNIYELIKDRKTYLPQNKVKFYMYQLFKALEHLHRKGIFHRDIKPENILISQELVKLADLGSCHGTQGQHPYTEYISTRWYRSPECLMTDGFYDQKMDIWGAGCVMFEVLTLVPLFPGKNELDMIHRIHNIIGTPHPSVFERFKKHASHLDFNFPQKDGTGIEKLVPHVTSDCLDLLKKMLTYDPEKRISAAEVLQHEYFREMVEAEKQKEAPSSLNSSRPSPSSKQFDHNTSQDHEKSSTFYNEKSQIYGKKVLKGGHQTSSKFPSMNLNVKVEGLFKQNQDTSIDDENEKPSLLPAIKGKGHGQNIHLETKLSFNTMNHPLKKKDENRKMNTMIKPSLSNQMLYNKKPLKNAINQGLDYYIVGKKAN